MNKPKPSDDKLTGLENAMKEMEGMQMPVLIAGENWWPERYVQEREATARREGMQTAKRVVLRRTKIPAGARNPTRDAVVILGEQIADLIDAALKGDANEHQRLHNGDLSNERN